MKHITFRPLLFEAAFCVMACDGEVHEQELAEIKTITENTLYFDGLDHGEELNRLIQQFQAEGKKHLENFFEQLEQRQLDDVQKERLIEVCLRVITADDKVEDSELQFLQKVKQALGLTDAALVALFPRHVDILMQLQTAKELKQAPQLGGISFDGADELFTKS